MTSNDTVQAMVERLTLIGNNAPGCLDANGTLWHPANDMLQAAALLLSLQAELGEARKDAERYRWLRVERSRLTHAYTEGFRLWVQGDVTPAESLDAAIDAAREGARGSDE